MICLQHLSVRMLTCVAVDGLLQALFQLTVLQVQQEVLICHLIHVSVHHEVVVSPARKLLWQFLIDNLVVLGLVGPHISCFVGGCAVAPGELLAPCCVVQHVVCYVLNKFQEMVLHVLIDERLGRAWLCTHSGGWTANHRPCSICETAMLQDGSSECGTTVADNIVVAASWQHDEQQQVEAPGEAAATEIMQMQRPPSNYYL